MTAFRIFQSDKPTLRFGPVLPMDPAEQRVLDELRRRRDERQRGNTFPTNLKRTDRD